MLPETLLPENLLPESVPHRRAVLYGLCAAGGLLLLWVLAYLASGGIADGTTVRGVEIGGMSRAAAEAKLNRELADDAARPVAVRVGDETLHLDPKKAGLRLDVPATLDAAGARSWNPVTLVRGFFGGGEVAPVTTADKERLRAAVDTFADKADRKPVEGGVRFEGAKVVPVPPGQGRTLDRPGAVEALRSSYLEQTEPIELPAELTDPHVTQDEVDRAVKEFAEPAMSAPVTLVVDGKRAVVPPRLIGPALSLKPDENDRLKPSLDGHRLLEHIAAEIAPLEVQGRDATFRIVGGRPHVVPSAQGRTVDAGELAKAVLPVLTEKGDARRAEVSLHVSDPSLTTAEAQALGVRELVSQFTTYYPSNFRPRLVNIHRAADLMNNTLVLPGDEFSLNREVGERTEARGFAAGYIIDHGKLEVDFGGGVSQLATTTFNAMFFAGLEDVEHHPHSFYISRYPEGREATVAWGAKDLRFRNDSGHGIFVTTAYTNSSVTVRMWGTKVWSEVRAGKSARSQVKPFKTIYDPRPLGTKPGDCVKQDGVEGFAVDVTRALYRGGTPVRTERFHTVYQPEDRIVCGATGPRRTTSPTATPSPTPTPTSTAD